MKVGSCLLLFAIACLGCATPGHFGRGQVASALASRTGHELGGPGDLCHPAIPDGVNQDDGLSEDEAVAIALWNNAAYQELLTDLGAARANVVQANLLTNPTLRWLVRDDPLPTQLFATIPLEAIWLRPRRIKAAQLESEQTAERLVQSGLDVVRDVRLAYVNVVLAEDRVRLSDEAAELRLRIARIAEARLKAGDASELESATARIDALRAKQDVRRLAFEVDSTEETLRNQMGLGLVRMPLDCRAPAEFTLLETDPESLVAEAISTRPDLVAVEHSVTAAQTRARLARTDYLGVALVSQTDSTGPGGVTRVGPLVTIPIFDQNQGNIARAEAILDRARHRYGTLREQIVLEVRQAHIRLAQADLDLKTWNGEVLPALETAVRQAEKSFADGDTNLLLMLESSRRLVEAQVRAAEVTADLRRARAELERSVGRRLFEAAESLPPGVERKL